MPSTSTYPYRPVPLAERPAFNRWRKWARHTIKHMAKDGPETDDESWRRRWHGLPERTKAEFRS